MDLTVRLVRPRFRSVERQARIGDEGALRAVETAANAESCGDPQGRSPIKRGALYDRAEAHEGRIREDRSPRGRTKPTQTRPARPGCELIFIYRKPV